MNKKQGTHEQYDLVLGDPKITIVFTDYILTIHQELFWGERINKTAPAPKELV